MTKTLRDLLLDAHQLQSELRDAGLFAAAGRMDEVVDAIRNRQAYDDAGGETTDEDEG